MLFSNVPLMVARMLRIPLMAVSKSVFHRYQMGTFFSVQTKYSVNKYNKRMIDNIMICNDFIVR